MNTLAKKTNVFPLNMVFFVACFCFAMVRNNFPILSCRSCNGDQYGTFFVQTAKILVKHKLFASLFVAEKDTGKLCCQSNLWSVSQELLFNR